MGKKRAGESSRVPSLPKKSSRASSSTAAPARTRGNKDAYPLILPPSTRGLTFASDAQKSKYETLCGRLASEQKFMHADSLRTLGLYDDMIMLVGNLGLSHFVERHCVAFDRLTVEFLSSLKVEWNGSYKGEVVHVSFRMFNTDHCMSLRGFNTLMNFPVHPDSLCDVPQLWKPGPAWLSITCAKRKSYTDRFGRPKVYDPRQAKATDICNPTIRYLQRLLANIVFGRNDSQNVCRKGELFLLWCALTGTHVNIGAFILRHLTEVARTTHENVISVGATITAIAESLGHTSKFHTLEPHFVGGVLDIATLGHMSILDTKGGTIKYPHHRETLFTFPAVSRTAIANKRNWNCDRVIVRERCFSLEEEEEGEEEEEEEGEEEEQEEGGEEERGGEGHAEATRDPPVSDPFTTQPPPQMPFSGPFDMGGSSSAGQVPFDSAFLQSFATLQLDVAGLREGFSTMQSDVHRMAGRMDSIEEGVSYFRGYVDRQETREERRLRREEERAMREAREYEERRRLNELVWQQSEAIRRLEQRFAPTPGDQDSSSTFSPFPPHFWPPPGTDGAP